jgi:hypothetical protein
MTYLPANRANMLRNTTCVYCRCDLEQSGWNKEHVIGRRFVPKGSLGGCWNLIVRACPQCNGRKSDLEDDLSAVTMAPDVEGRLATDDALLASEAGRKGTGSVSRRTGKPVAKSAEAFTVRTGLGSSISVTAKMVGPPQLNHQRAFELARLQMCAVFYRITYDSVTNTGRPWPGVFVPVMLAPRSDWGSPMMLEFMRATRSWPYRFLGITASGYFKAAVRKHPDQHAAGWAWAVEWNQNLRVVGFFGSLEPGMVTSWSLEEWLRQITSRHPGGFFAMRLERRLPASEDTLFAPEEKAELA